MRARTGRGIGGAQRGFSLIEIVVAFALMALVLTTALAVSARAYRQVDWSGRAAEAAQWAQSLADEAEGRPLALGRESGSVGAGRYRWSREVGEYRDPDGLILSADGQPRLWRSVLEVRWRDGEREHAIRLVGLRVGDTARPADDIPGAASPRPAPKP
ncbi:prepilin-type N-terminal cleavage/methylation domain-containing protein [Lysobacter pythonis]|uniref:Prepilin-type N-terminal cleavage/methylation domain-containing protein n=1 Tax=Solilutibacter pythonis TaxID=2483112 RepID=A0A3M2HMB9_9GAMM|nr:prepilin-type N-terminal cleavage/methylation domain-containing protein [Lysobacter pythonis]RMH90861.1 prepilin-type N-terminal cleavage/methylation domain-containing protein [Lysobacter pythonis]